MDFNHDPATDGRPPILIVEDSRTSLAVLSRGLSDQYTLLSAGDGEEAWEKLTTDARIELVVTDIQMPRLSGQQLLARIRKSDDPHISSLPVIVMTAASDNAEKNLAFTNGANDFLNKPVDPLELQARVNVHYRLARTIRELETNRKQLADQATTDPLTRLRNRRAFYDQSAQALENARRYRKPMSVVVIDIDFFKKINDTHGHQAGDAVLQAVANKLTEMMRAGDTVARFGGEEFAVLLPETNRLGTAVLAERLRQALEKMPISYEGRDIPVTASLGVATQEADQVDTIDELLNIADRRLYMAKNSGRNRIVVNDEGKSTFA
jgi:diguanylate cyclase (GGDEF)-like protein